VNERLTIGVLITPLFTGRTDLIIIVIIIVIHNRHRHHQTEMILFLALWSTSFQCSFKPVEKAEYTA
jgi:hypothetical protein